jgi:hypothetical protein
MEWEDFQKTRQFIEKNALALMKHEGKANATLGVPSENYTPYFINDRIFYSLMSNGFKHLIETYYMVAHRSFPEKFGTGNAMDVLRATMTIAKSK